jgi:hypothetical protein
MLSLSTLHAQDDPVEIYLIESFITPELPNTFVLTFFTSQICKSIVVFKSGQEIEISNEYVEEHKARIDLTPYEIDTTFIKYNIFLETEDGKIIKSETYEVEFPGLIKMKGTWLSYAWTCCIGGIVFGLPAPTYVNIDGEDKFSLAKEIPLFSFFSTGKNYPYGYIGIEYAYIFKMKHNNFMRVGYKQMFQPGTIEYISPGVNLFTNFNGYNGISPEVTIGLFRFYNTFALYTRYRYNFQPVKGGIDFHEISIGLYSNFFSINL